MDTIRLALSAKQLAAIPDAPVVVAVADVTGLKIALDDLRESVIALQRNVAELQAQAKGGPHAEKSGPHPRTPEPY